MIEEDRLPVEGARLTFSQNGGLDIVVGTQSTGQDHALPLVRHAALSFGLPPEKIAVRQGDTTALSRGGGTGGSKSLLTSSVALQQAITDAIGRGRALLAHEWKTTDGEIRFEGGLFSLPGSNVVMSVADIASSFPGALDG